MKRLIVKSVNQTAELWHDLQLVKTYSISTAKNGLGNVNDSYCTPTGKLRVYEKIGDGEPIYTIFESRVPTGRTWRKITGPVSSSADLILTRILWLEGAEEQNMNTLERYIYLHGTNHEDKLGSSVSHGCIRFANDDILEIFEELEKGDQVFVE